MDSSKDKEKKSLKSYPIDTLSQLNWRKGIKKLVQRNIKRIYIFFTFAKLHQCGGEIHKTDPFLHHKQYDNMAMCKSSQKK